MKFHQLTLYNVKNLRGTYFLDFDMHFGSEELFLIFGELGSGKTTIFDGISLALYGQTPQLQSSHTSKSNDSIRHILNTECEKCFASLVFSFLGEEFYRATWFFQNLRNNRTISAPKRTLERLNKKFEVVETLCSTPKKKEFESHFAAILRGLSFSDFIRSVFLPQNQFTTFIREEPKKRTAILERITNTEVYAKISDQVEVMYDESRREVQKLEETLKGLPNPEQVRGLKARAKVLKKLLSFGEIQKEAIEKSTHIYEQNIRKNRLESTMKAFLERMSTSEKALSALDVLCVEKEEEAKKLLKKKQEHLILLEENTDRFTERKAHLEQISLVSSELDRANKEKKQQQRTLSSMPKATIPKQKDVERAEREYLSNRDDLIKLLGEHTDQEGQPDMRIQGDLSSRYRIRLRYLEQRMEQTIKIEQSYEKIAAHEEELARYEKALQSIDNERKKKQKEQTVQKQGLEKVAHRVASLRTDILLYQARLQPQSLRKDLQAGEPCSVCGSIEHPFHGDSMEEEERFAKRLKELQIEQKQQEKEQKKYHSKIEELSWEGVRLEERLHNGNEKIEEKKSVIAEAYKKCSVGLHDLGIKERTALESLHTHAKNYKMSLQEAFECYEKSFQKHNTLLKERSEGVDREAQRERLQARLEQIQKIYSAKEIEKQTLATYLHEINTALCQTFSLQTPNEIDAMKVRRKYELEQQYERVKSNLDMRIQKKNQIKEILVQLEKEKADLEKSHAVLLEEYEPICISFKELLVLLREGPETMFPPDSTFEECIRICIDGEREIVYRILEWEKEQKDNEALLDLYEQNKSEIKTLDTLKNQSQGWVELRNALNKGLKFREFAQAWQLQNLINRANVQLQQILKGYHLSPVKDEDGHPKLDFNISKGGESVRPITTLSGGESFSIALAFALALGNLRKIHMPIQTLLIDEGFGNLDHQSADMVVSGLESLKKKNIQVGLISHVQTLQERIAARISVQDLFLGPQKMNP